MLRWGCGCAPRLAAIARTVRIRLIRVFYATTAVVVPLALRYPSGDQEGAPARLPYQNFATVISPWERPHSPKPCWKRGRGPARIFRTCGIRLPIGGPGICGKIRTAA